MRSELEFIINKIQLSENGGMVEIDTQILVTSNMEKQHDGLHRQYCNFIITYNEYLIMKLKVGDSIRMNIIKVISHVNK